MDIPNASRCLKKSLQHDREKLKQTKGKRDRQGIENLESIAIRQMNYYTQETRTECDTKPKSCHLLKKIVTEIKLNRRIGR